MKKLFLSLLAIAACAAMQAAEVNQQQAMEKAKTFVSQQSGGHRAGGWLEVCWIPFHHINEIRSAVLVMHGADAHSRYFGEAAYHYMVDGKADGYKFVGEPNPNPENKQLLIIPDASHCDLYDGGYEEKAGQGQPKNMIPWDKLAEFFTKNLK